MFYSHQLLARKAPLGQIWMAATLHAKMNRKKLSKLNIIKICEEILNPSIPMALRLSGILMGGVVIVYERKVKLLYDDVTRLLVEINEAWKVKAEPDPTLLPKGKTQAKKEKVTLPDNQVTDLGDIEQSLNFTSATTSMGFQQSAYIAMRLDKMDEPFINGNPMEEEQSQHFHQADAENITLFECFGSYPADTGIYDRFERFDIEGDEDMQPNFTSGEPTQIPTTLIPSPPLQDESQRANEDQEHLPEHQVNQEFDEYKGAKQDKQRKEPIKRKTKRPAAEVMDYEQTMIPGHMYQSWLQNASDIVSKRRRKKRAQTDVMSKMKIADLMELPSLVLVDDLITKGNRDINYPEPLLQLWMNYCKRSRDSPSARNFPTPNPEASSLSPPERMDFPFEDFQSGVGSQSSGVPMEKQRANFVETGLSMETQLELRANLMNNGMGASKANPMVTPGNSDGGRSIPSSASGHDVPLYHSEVNSGRTNKKRPYSSSRHSGSGLEPVDEENPWRHPNPDFKLSMLPENDLTPDQELFVETAATQTQPPIFSQPIDKITDSIQMHMKMHFDTPGVPQKESLNNLAAGMNRKGAAMLFYQTCVLASRDFLQVEQKVPYGDIFISRGAKM